LLYAVADPRAKQKMTFRVAPDLVRSLRQLPNQTAFVESALRQALGHTCPLCHGTGQTEGVHLAVSDLKELRGVRRIDRVTAARLRSLVRLGRALLATELELELEPTDRDDAELGFRLAREDEVLLAGHIRRGDAELNLSH
jgi:hypothetical protein